MDCRHQRGGLRRALVACAQMNGRPLDCTPMTEGIHQREVAPAPPRALRLLFGNGAVVRYRWDTPDTRQRRGWDSAERTGAVSGSGDVGGIPARLG